MVCLRSTGQMTDASFPLRPAVDDFERPMSPRDVPRTHTTRNDGSFTAAVPRLSNSLLFHPRRDSECILPPVADDALLLLSTTVPSDRCFTALYG